MPSNLPFTALGLFAASLAACAPTPVADRVAGAPRHFDPAPTPSHRYTVTGGSQNGSLAVPLPRIPNPQAEPVSSSPAHGAIVSGLRESF